jgi:hypothetical protein
MADESDGGVAGGSGKASGSTSGTVLSEAATTVTQLVAIVKGLEALASDTERSVACEVDNVSGHTLNFDSSHFDHGGFGSVLPPTSVPDQKAGLFAAKSSGVLVGVEGRVTYTVDDGKGTKFHVGFDNPELGGNSASCNIDSPISNAYFTNSITGNGNNGAHMRFVIGHLNAPFSLKTFLKNTKPSGFNEAGPSTAIRNLTDASGIIAGGNKFSIRTFMRV